VPTQMFHIELSASLSAVPVLPQETSARRAGLALVRLHGHPLGTVSTHLEGRGRDPEVIAETVWAELADAIRDHCRADGHPVPNRLGPEGLPARPCRRPLTASAESPFVSVVLPTLSRPLSLSRCLESLLAVEYPHFEVIIVDNDPADSATRWVADRLRADPRFRYVSEPRRGASRARNRGLAEARGTLVAFTDDDVVVDRHWLSALAARFAEVPRVACVTGLVIPARLDSIAQHWFEEYGGFNKGFTQRNFELADESHGGFFPYAPGAFGSGNNVAFRTDDLRVLGGYDEALGPGTHSLAGEDLALFVSVITTGGRLGYEPSAIVHHDHRESHAELLDQLHAYGVGLSAMLTGRALSSPYHFRAIVRRIPRGVLAVLSTSSWKNANRSRNYPRDLNRAEIFGLLRGPWAYLRSRSRTARSARWGGAVAVEVVEGQTGPVSVRSTSVLPARLRTSMSARARSHFEVPLFRSAYALVASTALTSVLGVLYWAMAARRYAPQEVGRAATLISAMILISGVAQLNLTNGLPRFLPSAGERTRHLVVTAYLAGALLAASAATVFVSISEQGSLGLNGGVAWLGRIWFVLAVVTWCIFALQDGVLTGLRQAVWVPVENGLFAVLKIVLLLVFAGSLQHIGIFASWTLPVALSLVPVNLLIFRRLIPRHRARVVAAPPPHLPLIVRYLAADYLGSLFQIASVTVLPLLVAARLGLEQAAFFYAAWVVASAFELVLANLGTSLLVEGASDELRIRSLTGSVARLACASVIPILAATALFAPQILAVLGHGYAAQGTVLLRLVCLGMVFRAAVVLHITVARVQRRIRAVLFTQMTLCLGVLGLSFTLVPTVGIAGVGIAYAVTQGTVAVALTGVQLVTKLRRGF
jgi:glycosyltransferase involved in cell wall biosynthesis/O-antigen/teichoic acid export membrane protein